jgi:uncharacterized membrane protein YfcA
MKARHLDLSDNAVNAEHQALGLPPLEVDIAGASSPHPALRLTLWAVVLMLGASALLAANLWLQRHAMQETGAALQALLSNDAFRWALAVGFIAQAVDGALGMAYGITATSFLLATGTPPAVASAGVHIAEVFTTGVSGIAHIRLGNVCRQLFLRLLLPGAAGAALGAWLVTTVDGARLAPLISLYLLAMGLYILGKVVRRIALRRDEPRHVRKLALVGGFVDAAGGGGWGPVVTTTLVGSGRDPRTTIGTVNLAEFFLTFITAGVFTALVPVVPWATVAGLVLGGLFAAPFAALMTRRLHTRTLLVLVGGLVVALSSFNLWRALA